MVSYILKVLVSSTKENGWKPLVGSEPWSVFHQVRLWQSLLMVLKGNMWVKIQLLLELFLQMALVLLRWRTFLCSAAFGSLWTMKRLIATGSEVKCSESCSVVSDSLWPHGLYSQWSSLGQDAGVGSLFLLQGIFPTQGSNQGGFFTSWATREAHICTGKVNLTVSSYFFVHDWSPAWFSQSFWRSAFN